MDCFSAWNFINRIFFGPVRKGLAENISDASEHKRTSQGGGGGGGSPPRNFSFGQNGPNLCNKKKIFGQNSGFLPPQVGKFFGKTGKKFGQTGAAPPSSVVPVRLCFRVIVWYPLIVCDAQALLKKSKGGVTSSSEGGIGTLVFNEIWYFLKMKVSFLLYWFFKQSKRVLFLPFFHFLLLLLFFFWKKGLNIMKWLINKTFLTPSVEQLLSRQIDSRTSKTMPWSEILLLTKSTDTESYIYQIVFNLFSSSSSFSKWGRTFKRLVRKPSSYVF